MVWVHTQRWQKKFLSSQYQQIYQKNSFSPSFTLYLQYIMTNKTLRR
jgi:hypothetical protein